MLNKLIGKFTNSNEHKLSQIRPLVEKINSHEDKFAKFSNEDIRNKTAKWQKHLRSGDLSADEINEYLNEILPEAYALVREAAKRSMDQRARDVQLIAAVVLHQGKIAEQKTGEGKTLTATFPLYLNSLTGKGAHLVTPNDYLSKHGAGWYGPLYNALGIKVGVIVHDESFVFDPSYLNPDVIDEYSRFLKPITRVEAYQCDITYGTNSEFGFDYLRDNMANNKANVVQSNPIEKYALRDFAIVDEVDSILIDIARTPLIISSAKDLQPERYYEFARLAEGLVKQTDYEVDEKDQVVTLTELGINKLERKLGVANLYENDFETVHHIENSLKAKALFTRDKDYVVKDGEVIIVDQNTGRLLPGNRWNNGLHQAVEAKEAVNIQPESKTVAQISYQNYYRLYSKLAGMTGTAETEAEEFFKMYSLEVVVIPTNRPVVRVDQPDLVFKTEAAKFRAIAKDIQEHNKKGQPVLIGTTSEEKSQLLASLLKRMKVPHEVLNAKNNEKEAGIIAQAGKRGAVTVSTKMAGRGVDIRLGGDPFDQHEYDEVVKHGGLYVIGTERHDSRRIDNQLRGRSGRQGDMGESRFFLSLQDDLLRIFGGEKIEAIMARLGVDENTPIEAGMISRSIENAQKKVEGMNFDRRRTVVEYDDVMNVQRESIYSIRRRILFADSTDDKKVDEFFDWMLDKLSDHVEDDFAKRWVKQIEKYGPKVWFEVIKQVALEVIDILWMEHIDSMSDLQNSVRLRGYGQIDPIIEYKREGKQMFEALNAQIWHTVGDRLSKVQVQIVEQKKKKTELPKMTKELDYEEGRFEPGVNDEIADAASVASESKPVVNANKVGRNDPCPCGSGKKYKRCHGR